MDTLRTLLSCCFSLFRGRRPDVDLDEELRTHIDFAIEENLWAGMSREDLRTAALRSFGGGESGVRVAYPASICGIGGNFGGLRSV